jgi:hypothetical protein
MTFEALKEAFRAKEQAQYIDYLDNITAPRGVAIRPSQPIIWRQITQHRRFGVSGTVPITFRTLCQCRITLRQLGLTVRLVRVSLPTL